MVYFLVPQMSAVPLRDLLGLGFGFFLLGCFLLWVVNALNFPITATARKKEKVKVLQEGEKKFQGTLGGQDRHSQRPGNFIRKSVHMIPPD